MNYKYKTWTIPKDYFKPRMVASELRIGNWIESYTAYLSGLPDSMIEELPGRHIQVDTEILKMIDKAPLLVTMKPIPITPEILERCGAEDGEIMAGGGYLHFSVGKYWTLTREPYYTDEKNLKGKFVFEFQDNEFGFQASDVPPITYLHQLQNLYFALTGTELKYKIPA